jgi:hypothetical protein
MALHARSGSNNVVLQDDICRCRAFKGRCREQALAVRATFTALRSLWLSPQSFRLMIREIPVWDTVGCKEMHIVPPRNAISTCSTNVLGTNHFAPHLVLSVSSQVGNSGP